MKAVAPVRGEVVQPSGTKAGVPLPARVRVQSAGAAESCGWKGAAALVREKSEAMLRRGSRAMLSMAAMVLEGEGAAAGVAAGVVALKRLPQEVESPAAPPLELMQAARMSARVSIWAMGAVAVAGSDGPGMLPVAGSTRAAARAKAAERPLASRAEEPMAETEVMKGERDATAATVVRSSMEMKVEGVSEPQEPRSVMRASAALLVPAVRPGLPPVAAM